MAGHYLLIKVLWMGAHWFRVSLFPSGFCMFLRDASFLWDPLKLCWGWFAVVSWNGVATRRQNLLWWLLYPQYLLQCLKYSWNLIYIGCINEYRIRETGYYIIPKNVQVHRDKLTPVKITTTEINWRTAYREAWPLYTWIQGYPHLCTWHIFSPQAFPQ